MVEYDPFVHYEDRYPVYKSLRDEAPIYYNERRDIWAFFRTRTLRAAARDWQTFSNAGGGELAPPQAVSAPGDLLNTDPTQAQRVGQAGPP